MDCFKSGRDLPPEVLVPVVLAGRGGADDSPRKSRPSREEFEGVVLGGAGSALGGTLLEAAGGPAVLARGGALSTPPIRSATGGAAGRGAEG